MKSKNKSTWPLANRQGADLDEFYNQLSDMFDQQRVINLEDIPKVLKNKRVEYVIKDSDIAKETYLLGVKKEIFKCLLTFRKASAGLLKNFRMSKMKELKDIEPITLISDTQGNSYEMLDSEKKMYYMREIKDFRKNEEKTMITANVRAYALRHVCILPLLGWMWKKNPEDKSKTLCYIYKYLPDTLEYYLSIHSPLDPKTAKNLIIKLCYAYLYLYSKGLDYNPEVIFIDGEQPVFGFLEIDEETEFPNKKKPCYFDSVYNLITRIYGQTANSELLKIGKSGDDREENLYSLINALVN